MQKKYKKTIYNRKYETALKVTGYCYDINNIRKMTHLTQVCNQHFKVKA